MHNEEMKVNIRGKPSIESKQRITEMLNLHVPPFSRKDASTMTVYLTMSLKWNALLLNMEVSRAFAAMNFQIIMAFKDDPTILAKMAGKHLPAAR